MSDEINLKRIYKTGEICSCSGQYAIVDEKGIATKREITMVRGNQFPPPRGGQGYVLVDPTQYDASCQGQNDKYSKLVLSLCGYYLIVLLFSFWLLFDTWSRNFMLVRLIGVSGEALEEPLLRTIGFTIIAGIMGSVLYQMRMLFKWYAKEQKFDPRWLGKYVTAPWEGAGMAMVVLSLIRGGVGMFGGSMETDVTPLTNFAAFGTGSLVGFGMRDVVGWLESLVKTMFSVKDRDEEKGKSRDEDDETQIANQKATTNSTKDGEETAPGNMGQTTDQTTSEEPVG